MAYSSWSVVFNEQPSAAKWNILGSNDSFFNDQVGSNFGSGTTSTVWWEEIGRTTLGSAGDTITVSSLPTRKYLKLLVSIIGSGSLTIVLQFNNDSGSNYSERGSANGAADTTAVSQTSFALDSTATSGNVFSMVYECLNIAAQEKILQGNSVARGTAGAAATPNRADRAGKWSNTSDAISRVDVINTNTGDFATGSEVIVLGHD